MNTRDYLAFRGFVASNSNQRWVPDGGKDLLEGDWVGLTPNRWEGLEDQVQRPEESKRSLEAETVAQMPQPLFSSLLDFCFSCWSHDTHSTLILWRFCPLVCIRLDPNLMLFAWLLGLGCGRTQLLSWLLKWKIEPCLPLKLST